MITSSPTPALTRGTHASVNQEGCVLHIPRVGDEWDFTIPGKSRKRKIIGWISYEWHQGKWESEARRFTQSKHPRVNWRRLNKGRYTSIRVKWLLKYGRRVSTEADRDARLAALIATRSAQRTGSPPKPDQRTAQPNPAL